MRNERRKRKNQNIDDFWKEFESKIIQEEERKKEMLSSTDYIDKLFQLLEKHERVGSNFANDDLEYEIQKDLSLFFELIDKYAKKYMVKNYVKSDGLLDEIYYISHGGNVASLKHLSSVYGGEVLVEKCTRISDVESIAFSDVMQDKVPDILLERVKAKNLFEKTFFEFLEFAKKEGFSNEYMHKYIHNLLL